MRTAAFLAVGLGLTLTAWSRLPAMGVLEPAAAGFWPLAAAGFAFYLMGVRGLAHACPGTGWRSVEVPLLFGALLLLAWEFTVRAVPIQPVLLPSPSAIALRITHSLPVLWQDFVQTYLRSVVTGWILGSALGFAAALAADRWRFLGRGLRPIASLASALPLVGIAPIAVMWFGFDWQSKAAVAALVCFFPMLAGTSAGLATTPRLESDLMRSWAASPRTALLKLRLPAAMPFVLDALKLNATLALIAAIVAEFFGTPTVGMGFRISVEVGRLALDMVWAEIALAALVGSLAHLLLSRLERALIFWHPSIRGRQ